MLDESAIRDTRRPKAPHHREYPIRYSSVVKDLLRSTLRLESGTGYQQKPIGLFGGDNRDRTGNLRLAKPALSQLSYIPKTVIPLLLLSVVGLGRFELPTSRLSGVRSNQLSYRPG